MTYYPDAIASFTTKYDNTTTVMADHVNALQSELVATQNALGVGIKTSVYSDTTPWAGSDITYSTLSARLENIERGLVNGVSPSPYLTAFGGGSVTNDLGVAITTQGVTGSTNDLIQSKDTGDNVRFSVDWNGIPYVDGQPVIYKTSTEYVEIMDAIDAAIAAIPASTVVDPLLLAGM